MFLMNVESLMPGVQNLWSEVRFFLLSAETLPVLLISKAVTVVLMCVMSVEKCAYLFVLSILTSALQCSHKKRLRGDRQGVVAWLNT